MILRIKKSKPISIDAIKIFFDAYSQAERMWHAFPTVAITERKYSIKELDDMIWPSLNAVKNSLVELNLYFAEIEMKKFEIIYDSLMEIYQKSQDAYFEYSEDKHKFDTAFQNARLTELRKNDSILKEIGANTRKKILRGEI